MRVVGGLSDAFIGMNNPRLANFLAELRRRKVYRIAAGYFVVGWSIIQISSTVFAAWDMPRWALRLVMILVLSGFPIALVLAWAFDLTPAGTGRTKLPADPGTSIILASRTTRKNALLVSALGILISLSAGVFLFSRAPAHKLEKSIAVLPFDSLSEVKENAYFADGVQDDLLTSLAKIGDLKVISRTSVMSYRGNTRNIREIGKALGVGAVLERSVRRSGNRVRVNVQLIDASNDEHI